MVVAIEGDVGDTIFALGCIQHIPSGPHALLLKTSGMTKIRTQQDLERYVSVIAPLASAQSYISECRIMHGGERVDWDSGGFRGTGIWCPKTTLLGAHAYHLNSVSGINVSNAGKERWLHNVTPSPLTHGRIIVSRTGRYRNGCFPWQEIVNHYGDRLLFVGLKHEYLDFCGEFGAVEFKKTANMLEVAELIAGSALFIGNQSSPNAIAEGLKHPLIQETCLHIPDCIFLRSNAQHVSDRACHLPDVDGSGEMGISMVSKDRYVFRTHKTPPDGWQYGGKKHTAWNALILEVKRLPEFAGKTELEIAPVVMEKNWIRKPDFFRDDAFSHQFHIFQQAMKSAALA